MTARIYPFLWCLLVAAGVFSPEARGQRAKRPELPGIQSLDVCVDGDHLHLLLGRRAPGGAWEITHCSSADWGGTWSPPVAVHEGSAQPHVLHRGSDARLAVSGSRLLAVWTARGTDKWGSGPLATALSGDAGRTWAPGPNPADDGRTDGHGFVAAGTTAAGAFHLAWLDNRGDQRGLRYAQSRDGGETWSANATAVPRTCECCWNALVPTGDGGAAVLYRMPSPRDMAVVRTSDGGAHWTTPKTVGEFGWNLQACPHVGGALARSTHADTACLHAVVWTGQPEKAGVYHMRSKDEARTWSPPRRMGAPQGSHPHLAAGGSGAVAVVWDAPEEGKFGVWTCVSRDHGDSWSVPIRLSRPSEHAEYPRIVPTPGGFRVFWTGGIPGQDATWSSVSFSFAEDRFAPSFGTLLQ
jgi:hypothetical protein